jgi:hypothetical protein
MCPTHLSDMLRPKQGYTTGVSTDFPDIEICKDSKDLKLDVLSYIVSALGSNPLLRVLLLAEPEEIIDTSVALILRKIASSVIKDILDRDFTVGSYNQDTDADIEFERVSISKVN